MDSDAILDELVERGVLTQTRDGHFQLTPDFRETIRECEAEIRAGDGVDLEGVLVEEIRDSPTLLATYSALAEALDLERFTVHDRVQLLTSIVHFDRDSTPTAGAPDAFLSVRGDQLPVLLRLYERAIVYAWREECDPCDAMRETFDSLFDALPADIMLFSVYGPEWAETLDEEYNVVGAPTTLFVVDGRVDARLLGAHERAKVEREVQKLRELSGSQDTVSAGGVN